jgi:hypothetical protein
MLVGRSGLVLGVSLVLGFAACGGSTEDGESGGIGGGGQAPNTCPPTLVNYGSGPGILCDEPVGTTCSDAEQFCVCGEQTIEGSPWLCVPTYEGCPSDFPDGEPCDANWPLPCDFLTDERMTCTCSSGIWVCEPSPCGGVYPGGGACTLDPGQPCEFFIPATPSAPDSARNVTCTCGLNQAWTCPPL